MRENDEQARDLGESPNERAAIQAEESGALRHARRPALLIGVTLWEACKSLVGAISRLASVRRHAPVPVPDEGEEKPRAGDRNLDPGRASTRHQRRGTALATIAFLLAIGGGFAFLYFYWENGDTPELGVSLAFFLGGLGCALVVYARWLMLRLQATELREQLASPPEEREAALQSFSEGADEIGRRGLLVGILVTALAFVVGIVVSLVRALGPLPSASLYDTIWRRGQRLTKSDGTPVSMDALQPGTTLIVFPEDRIGDERAQTMLVRVDERSLDLPADRKNWAPGGYVAYSRVCTHAGCPVGMYETTTQLLACPCHQSTFDVLRAARPTGGPAARALPQLPLYADATGILRAGGGFTQPPGPGFWEMPL
jgi:ubiquinol-cytochrome c reductase iron-sulfur subunit